MEKNNLACNEFQLIENQILSQKSELLSYKKLKESKINNLLANIQLNKTKIEELKSKLSQEKSELTKLKNIKFNKINIMSSQIDSIQKQISSLKNEKLSQNSNDISLLSKEITTLKNNIRNLEKFSKIYKKKILILERKQMQKNECQNMLKEEYFSCKKILIILTSKIESHNEFIKTLCKSKNVLSSSLQKLNEIEPENSEIANNVIEMNKLAEMIYSYCNEYLEFTVDHDNFINNIQQQDDIDKVIIYLQSNCKYSISSNFFEYVLIALCRIMTYEKMLDLRMNFINSIDNQKQEVDTPEKEKKIEEYRKKFEKNKEDLIKNKENLNRKEKIVEKINVIQNENSENLNKMNKDLLLMNKYQIKLDEKIKKKEIELSRHENEYEILINKLIEDNNLMNEKLNKKQLKLRENIEKLESKINELIIIKNNLINNNKVNEIYYKYSNNNLSEKNFIILQNLKPLFNKIKTLKRELIHFKQKIYENYYPVINNKPISPFDYDFEECFLNLDKNVDKLFIESINNKNQINIISTESIHKIEIPNFTKELIFLQKIYSNLNKKLKMETTEKINEYFNKEKTNIMKTYMEKYSKNEAIDQNMFNKDYREALLINKQYMIIIYLSPNENTKIEIIFQTRNDCKSWINGLDELVVNYRKIRELIGNDNGEIGEN